MAVNTQAFSTSLSQYGTVEFCDINNEISYIIIIYEYTGDETIFLGLVDQYLIQDYPYQTNLTLVNGILKAEYSTINIYLEE
jgi:uncharacterized pyridoxamine 5'-phosphate oxidase family protein